ncbi:putative respiratory burst oxidase homolog protein H [Impatiens glandulifera]|uniref:putative respiratory burst oxidase homolog protein H n=1 Tax=Impatiens glandulifera TaxID=253017 RepID=UPI001FB0A656|nr:putative respiratory burst oxidase homolog protein H [Impatiens glandulifera]
MKDSKEFAGELFQALARRRGIDVENGITLDDMRLFWEDMSNNDLDTRLQIFFDMCDKNGDGQLSEEEVKQVIIMSAAANKLSTFNQNAAIYAASIMEELDPDHLGYIEMRHLEILLREMVGGSSSSSEMHKKNSLAKRTRSLAKTMIPRQYRNPVSKFIALTKEKMHDHWKRIVVLNIWIIINLLLFVFKFMEYKHKGAFHVMGYCVCFAKGAAETLKFNMALILLPVCRKTLTRLRETFLGNVIPFDDNINFHKIVSVAIVIGTAIHTLTHVTCDFPRITSCSPHKFDRILGPSFDHKQPTYADLVRSIPGVTGILMVIIMSFVFTLATHSFRKNVDKLPWPLNYLGGFNAFWYAHHLLILVYVLFIIHGYFLFLTHEWYKKTV